MAKKEVVELDAREKRLKSICDNINKTAFGGEHHDAVTYLGSRDVIHLTRFSSGDMGIDEALGGGWPKGRFVELFGPESGGKTTLALTAIANHQKAFPDEDCGLIDTEFTFDEVYAANLGVNTKYLIVHQPDSGEQALNILKLLLQQGLKCIVVDSVAALVTKNELEGDIGDVHMGEQARLMSGALRQLAAEAGRNGAIVIWTNQVRDKIGVMFGDPTTTPAGKALPHYASIRCHIAAIGKVKEKVDGEEVVVSSRVRVTVKKNKTAPPFRKAEVCMSFGHGIDEIAGVLDMALSLKVVTKRGAWLSFGTDNIGQGRAKTMDFMRENTDVVQNIKDAITKAKQDGVKPETPPDVIRGNSKSEIPEIEDDGDPDDLDAGKEGAKVIDV